jgi:predicted AAA+ superfamily ATPase
MDYRPRIVDSELDRRLSAAGAVVIEGPKACGKTATARNLAASEVLLDIDANARQALAIDPRLVLDGDTPRLIDEWQVEPTIWNHIRRMVDERGGPGQFILTGSAVPADDITRHTGAGRLTRLRLRPMTLFELGRSSGAISLAELFAGDQLSCPDPGLNVADLAELISVGGWPGHLRLTPQQALQANRDYLDEIRRVDISRVDGVRRDPDKVGRLLRSLARNVSTCASATGMAEDIGGITVQTVLEYLASLERLLIVEDQPSWAPHLRSRSRLRSAAKRHLVDPSLAVAALRTTPDGLLKDMNLLGLLFESLVIRDLRVYAQALDAEVLHYRDNTGLEVDAIIQHADGRWGALEIKLGTGMVEQGAATLLKFADRVDTDKCGAPSLLAVITGSGYGYRRDDGVMVIPIGSLRPYSGLWHSRPQIGR